jgi:hypothetical protein
VRESTTALTLIAQLTCLQQWSAKIMSTARMVMTIRFMVSRNEIISSNTCPRHMNDDPARKVEEKMYKDVHRLTSHGKEKVQKELARCMLTGLEPMTMIKTVISKEVVSRYCTG